MPIDLSAEKLALIATRLREPAGALQYCMSDPIAVLGMACRFPGDVDDLEAFWRLLIEGRDAITEVPPSRWDISALYDPNPEAPGKIATRRGGFLEKIDRFDAGFFGISPREAAAMDPQQRIILEVTWDALERAGQPLERLSGSNTGIFVGVLGNDYGVLEVLQPERLDVYSGTGTAHNMLAGRIAYLLNLRGPAIALDTACSSSLVAVHAACQSLRTGECGMALAGAVNVILSAETTISLSRMRMLSPDGRCKTFDAAADGFVRSEGCGVLVLKRLADALAAHDPIAAVIRGSAVNQDGRSAGLTAPSRQAQEAVLRQALANAGVPAEAVEYVETHGAGTPLGDPIEVEALRAVYGGHGSRTCVLGAVKTNIGHAEAAAGMAGLIKAVLALEAEAIPGNLHLKQVNPNLPLAGTRFELATGVRTWRRRDDPRYAAVSSFGWSGTNAHLVVQEAPTPDSGAVVSRSSYLLPVSGRSPAAAAEMLVRYADMLTDTNLASVCAMTGARRSHHRYRAAGVGRSAAEMRASLGSSEVTESSPGVGVAFVYPGQGGQWAGMGRELYQEEALFRRAIQRCAARIKDETGWDLLPTLLGVGEWSGIDQVQPLLFALQVALTTLWRSWGVEPTIVVGHSMGEVAAAHVAGALSLQDAVTVICRRSRLLKTLQGRGGMGVVALDAAAAAGMLSKFGDRVSVAATNSRRLTVISGD
ncbi:MAG: type I polyketide synthase, partial [Chloroflexi bacterium]|nr:type I polyketide synthase [Chloroflexota bacterium]